MSIQTRVFATTIAVSLLVGTASFAASEPRQSRRVAIEEGQSFVEQVFERVRELLTGRREGVRTSSREANMLPKDGPATDPNGHK